MSLFIFRVCSLLIFLSLCSGQDRPNIVFVFADDMSVHMGAYGDPLQVTPNFDKVAEEGVLFNNAYVNAPSCTPSRSSTLTGRNFWELQEASQLFGEFPDTLEIYTQLLEDAGYEVGFSNKGWGPPDNTPYREFPNPAGKVKFNNLGAFLNQRDESKPFCFWVGSRSPHRGYTAGSGIGSGLDPDLVEVPSYYPDDPVIRSDILDYYRHVQQWFDGNDTKSSLDELESRGLTDRTIIVVTSDHGWPFPRGKSNLYDAGTRIPMAIRWPGIIKPGRIVDDFVSLLDIAPTFLEAAGVEIPEVMSGRSLIPLLESEGNGLVDETRDAVFFGKERHAEAREGNVGYPQRGIRTDKYLFIWNIEPERWPAGNPPGIYDIDGSPSLNFLRDNKDDLDINKYYELSIGIRPEFELYINSQDPGQIHNVAYVEKCALLVEDLKTRLQDYMAETGDPHMFGNGDIFNTYPYHHDLPDSDPVTPTEPYIDPLPAPDCEVVVSLEKPQAGDLQITLQGSSLKLELPGPGEYVMQVNNIKGEMVLRKKFTHSGKGSVQFNAPNLHQGIHLLRITQQDGLTVNQKVAIF